MAGLLFWSASAAPALAQVAVLVDASKDGGAWWFPQVAPFDPNLPHQGKALADYLRSQGMIVDEVPRSSTITYGQLSLHPLVVTAAVCTNHSPAEVSAYVQYVSNGGRLILLGDHDQSCTSDTLPQSLGLDITGSLFGSITSFTPHPITAGVASLPFAAGGTVTAPGTATILGTLMGLPVMGIMPFGSGQVFFLGDTNGIVGMSQPLVRNLFGFMLAGVRPPPAKPGDFDGDGKADLTVFRPSNGTWYVLRSGTNYTSPTSVQWGNALDKPVPGDYDRDGQADIAVFRPSNGTWYLRYSGTGMIAAFPWGNSSDVPVPGDYNGDGLTDIAVFRPSTGTWYLRYSGTGTTAAFPWGNGLDVPVPGDYDGDGLTDVAVFRPSTGTWYLRYSGTGATAAFQWGNASDVSVPADYNGDGKTDIGVFRPSSGTWYLWYSGTGTTAGFQWGNGSDVPVPGDYNRDGRADIAVFRPSSGTWYLWYSGTGTTAGIQWGNGADIPILKRP